MVSDNLSCPKNSKLKEFEINEKATLRQERQSLFDIIGKLYTIFDCSLRIASVTSKNLL